MEYEDYYCGCTGCGSTTICLCEPEPDMPDFDPVEVKTIAGRTIHIGGFPFTDNPPRDGSDVVGRSVWMGGKAYSIKFIERFLHALPYRFGETVGLEFVEGDT